MMIILQRRWWHDLQMLEEYADYLKSDYAEKIVKIFCECLEESVKKVSSRGEYYELAKHLGFLCTIPDGYEIASDLRDKWLLTYKNKPALKDELNKLKLENI